MNRRSLLVNVGRVFQKKFPFPLLRIVESPLTKCLQKKDSAPKLIIILALPRGGSTLAYQVLLHGLQMQYLSNLGNFLYGIPLIGGWISRTKCRKYKSDFTSDHGFVPGLCGPAEGLKFWSYWLNNTLRSEEHTSEILVVLAE